MPPCLCRDHPGSTRPRISVTFPAVVSPPQRLKVAEIIGAAFGDWFDVIDFPAVCRHFAVLVVLHPSETHILPKDIRVIPGSCFTFRPYGAL